MNKQINEQHNCVFVVAAVFLCSQFKSAKSLRASVLARFPGMVVMVAFDTSRLQIRVKTSSLRKMAVEEEET